MAIDDHGWATAAVLPHRSSSCDRASRSGKPAGWAIVTALLSLGITQTVSDMANVSVLSPLFPFSLLLSQSLEQVTLHRSIRAATSHSLVLAPRAAEVARVFAVRIASTPG